MHANYGFVLLFGRNFVVRMWWVNLKEIVVGIKVEQRCEATASSPASSRTYAVVAASATATTEIRVVLGRLFVRNHDPALLDLLAVVETDLANSRNRLDLGDGTGVLVEIPEGGRDLQTDLGPIPELDPKAALSVPRQEPTVAQLDLRDDGPRKVSLAGLRKEGVFFLLFLDESLEPDISGVEHAGLGPLVENVVDGGTLNGTNEVPGLGGGIGGHVFLEELPGLEPLGVVLSLDDPALGGRQELHRESKAHELVGKFLPLTGMKVHPGTEVGSHNNDKEGPDQVKEGSVGPAKMNPDHPEGKGRKGFVANNSFLGLGNSDVGVPPQPHDEQDTFLLGFFAFRRNRQEIQKDLDL